MVGIELAAVNDHGALYVVAPNDHAHHRCVGLAASVHCDHKSMMLRLAIAAMYHRSRA